MYEYSILAQGNAENPLTQIMTVVYQRCMKKVYWQMESNLIKNKQKNSELDPDNANSENGVSAMYDNSKLADEVKSNKKTADSTPVMQILKWCTGRWSPI